MKIQGIPGHLSFYPETYQEKAILGKAWRDAQKFFATQEQDDDVKAAMFYWGDAVIDGVETGAFTCATLDMRDYQASGNSIMKLWKRISRKD